MTSSARMPVVALAVAAVAFVGARFAREAAGATQDVGAEPYAPSPTSAPLVSLGFRVIASCSGAAKGCCIPFAIFPVMK